MAKKTYIAILASLILVGVLSVHWLPLGKKETPSILHDRAASFSSLLPPENMSADISVPVTQNVSAQKAPANVPPPPVPVPARTEPRSTPPPTTVPPTSAAPVSYIYFLTGVPVRTVTAPTIVYTGVSLTAAPAPVVQTFAVPVFVPQVVPSRVGTPRLVYSNGVVIKPKVYFPNQPVRNSIRFVGQ